jgi:hypothetical protein
MRQQLKKFIGVLCLRLSIRRFLASPRFTFIFWGKSRSRGRAILLRRGLREGKRLLSLSLAGSASSIIII